jgi:acyl carrier protein
MTDVPAPSPSPDRVQDLLRGFPPETVAACIEFHAKGDSGVFERAVCGVIEHHLGSAPATPVAMLPGTTRLVEDLGLDSLTMVEMTFLFEDLFSLKLPHDELVKITTLDELRLLLRTQLAGRSSAAA